MTGPRDSVPPFVEAPHAASGGQRYAPDIAIFLGSQTSDPTKTHHFGWAISSTKQSQMVEIG